MKRGERSSSAHARLESQGDPAFSLLEDRTLTFASTYVEFPFARSPAVGWRVAGVRAQFPDARPDVFNAPSLATRMARVETELARDTRIYGINNQDTQDESRARLAIQLFLSEAVESINNDLAEGRLAVANSVSVRTEYPVDRVNWCAPLEFAGAGVCTSLSAQDSVVNGKVDFAVMNADRTHVYLVVEAKRYGPTAGGEPALRQAAMEAAWAMSVNARRTHRLDSMYFVTSDGDDFYFYRLSANRAPANIQLTHTLIGHLRAANGMASRTLILSRLRHLLFLGLGLAE